MNVGLAEEHLDGAVRGSVVDDEESVDAEGAVVVQGERQARGLVPDRQERPQLVMALRQSKRVEAAKGFSRCRSGPLRVSRAGTRPAAELAHRGLKAGWCSRMSS